MKILLIYIGFKGGNIQKWRPNTAVPNLLAPGTSFVEDNFSWATTEGGSGGNASDAERQMRLRSLTRRSPPAVQPGS